MKKLIFVSILCLAGFAGMAQQNATADQLSAQQKAKRAHYENSEEFKNPKPVKLEEAPVRKAPVMNEAEKNRPAQIVIDKQHATKTTAPTSNGQASGTAPKRELTDAEKHLRQTTQSGQGGPRK